jgi:pimeloyl-ACP methyl ester carboxylesterase
MKPKHLILHNMRRTSLGLLTLLAGAATYLFWPVSATALASRSRPVSDYDEALRRITELQAQEKALTLVCQTQLLTHGQKTRRVVILVHGYTNCPAQYSTFAPQLFAQGSNVLMVPLPHHGLPDLMNEEHSRLTAEELTAYADQVVDIAQGLGDQVVMAGISLGGITTAWAAQNRSDIYRAVVISAPFGYKAIPSPLTNAAMRAFMLLPNSFAWWDPQKKEALSVGMPYAYPRYATRSLSQILRLGLNISARARNSPIQAGSLTMITNATDESVNLDMAVQITRAWQKLAPQKISSYQFPASLNLKHDLFDPHQEIDVARLAYPKIIELILAP